PRRPPPAPAPARRECAPSAAGRRRGSVARPRARAGFPPSPVAAGGSALCSHPLFARIRRARARAVPDRPPRYPATTPRAASARRAPPRPLRPPPGGHESRRSAARRRAYARARAPPASVVGSAANGICRKSGGQCLVRIALACFRAWRNAKLLAHAGEEFLAAEHPLELRLPLVLAEPLDP